MAKRKRSQEDRADLTGVAVKKSKASSDHRQEIVQPSQSLEAPGHDRSQVTASRDKSKSKSRSARKREKRRLSAKAKSRPDGETGKSNSTVSIRKATTNWQLSHAWGGVLSDVDPIFSADQQSLLLSYQSCVKVYQLSSSSRLRVLQPASKGTISGAVLSPLNPAVLYVSLSSGGIEVWDWTSATRNRAWDIKTSIFAMAAAVDHQSDTSIETLYTVDADVAKNKWRITGHRLRESADTELQTLYRSSIPLTNFQVLQDGRTIIASAGPKIILGSLRPSSASALKDQVYSWYEFECTEAVTCLDARMERRPKADGSPDARKLPKGAKAAKAAAAAAAKPLDLVVGGILGTIFVYEDILSTLARIASSQSAPTPTPRRFHWHSKLVGNVKWSVDGNYIISGGSETVLVFWQLDTGRSQFLPHLSAAIDKIVVSSDGSSYGVALSNNSTLVLSALKLEPAASIMGLQLPVSASISRSIPDVPRVVHQGLRKLSRRTVATVSSSAPGRLLLAVPASSISRLESFTSQGHTYLQTFDVRAEQSVGRQALTRTLITDLPTGPEGNTIMEPNVVLVCVTSCGKWLATVDEWGPPPQDVQASTVDDAAAERSLATRTEVHLNFWLWSGETQTWELVSKIDAPHTSRVAPLPDAGRVLDLVEDPSLPGFATLGDDGLVKVWRARTRYRDGVVIRGKNAEPAQGWVCQHSVPSPLPPSTAGTHSSNVGRLAFSLDGSLLCVAQQNAKTSLTFSIDPTTGQVHSLFPTLIEGSLVGLGLVEKYMIVLSDRLVAWDLVGSHVDETLSISRGKRYQNCYSHLAINQRHGTFAVGTLTPLRTAAQVRVFDTTHHQTLCSLEFSRPLKVLVSNPPGRGYIAVDDFAEVRIIGPTTALPTVPVATPDDLPHPSAGLEKILAAAKDAAVASNGDAEEPRPLPEFESTVIRQHQLAEIFEVAPPFALPPITRLFEQVAALFSRTITAV